MKKKQILLAVLFGVMLGVTGCGDDNGGDGGSSGTGGTGGTAGSGGGSGSGFCATLCNACGMDQAGECTAACESQLGGLPGEIDFDSCPNQLDALGTCLGNNDCNGDSCQNEYTAWFTCLISPF